MRPQLLITTVTIGASSVLATTIQPTPTPSFTTSPRPQTTSIPPECTYRPTATKWHTTGCEFNCPTSYYLAIDYLAPIPCGCSHSRIAVRPTTTTLCYTQSGCQGQWDSGWMVGLSIHESNCPGSTTGSAVSGTTASTTATVTPAGRMVGRQM
ncbi:hypothetical protein B0T14DRAFT_509214 [Immersiella caudata]|uniref:Uncharacterized protein n=1 Tax=Immersiella caudata TaxID=314043 RepID=A0AA39X364_9PEZI|nr:hypothetical protein B0T14DRAFT_509214 [Immersiella caudata]